MRPDPLEAARSRVGHTARARAPSADRLDRVDGRSRTSTAVGEDHSRGRRRHRLPAGRTDHVHHVPSARHRSTGRPARPHRGRAPGRQPVPGGHVGRLHPLLRAGVGALESPDATRGGKPRVPDRRCRGLLLLLRLGGGATQRVVLLRPRRLARRGAQHQLRVRRLWARIGAGELAAGGSCLPPRPVHAGLLSPSPLHLGGVLCIAGPLPQDRDAVLLERPVRVRGRRGAQRSCPRLRAVPPPGRVGAARSAARDPPVHGGKRGHKPRPLRADRAQQPGPLRCLRCARPDAGSRELSLALRHRALGRLRDAGSARCHG
jgi:hypothetical protein